MTGGEARALWENWAGLWNGDFEQQRIIAPDFRLHAALLDGSSDSAIQGPDAFVRWIAQARGPFETMVFATELGPLVSGEFVVGRWRATGVYGGGFPGAKAEPGTVVAFAGTDVLRVRDGLIAEYWVSSDTASLLAQLKVF